MLLRGFVYAIRVECVYESIYQMGVFISYRVAVRMLQTNTFIDCDGACALMQGCCWRMFNNGVYICAVSWCDCATCNSVSILVSGGLYP